MDLKSILSISLAAMILSCATPGKNGLDGQTHRHPTPLLIDIYQDRLDHLSAVRAGECPMHPSCSEYSAQAFEKHGFFLGWILTCDRLMRCGRDEIKLSPLVHIHGIWKHYDPLEANDGWWENRKTLHPLSFPRD